MENNDNLERFLKRAFGQYEETPPESVWANIQSGLAAYAASEKRLRRQRAGKWTVLAALLLLLSLLGLQNAYYRGEIGRLQEELSCAQAEKCPVLEQATPVQLPDSRVALKSIQRSATPLLPVIQEERPALVAGFEPLPFAVAGKITHNPSPPLSVETPPSRLLPAGPKRRWAVTRHNGLGYTFYVRSAKSASNLWQNRYLELIENNTVVKSQNFASGVALSYDMGNNWSIETGLTYRRFDSRILHRPDLKYGDRWDSKWWNNDQNVVQGSKDHDYSYFFDGPSGTIFVSLSAENTNPSEEISNQEDLNVEIAIEERLEVLSIPVLAGYQIGHGRFTGQLRAGLLANFGMDYDVKVRSLDYENDKFRPGERSTFLSNSPLNAFSFDFFLGAGVAYDLSPSWRVSFMPFFTGSLTKKLDGPFIDPNDYSIGGSAALSYRF